MATPSVGTASRFRDMPLLLRGILVVLGLTLGFAGIIAWSFEAEYGAGTNHVIECDGDECSLYNVDEQTGTKELLLVGTQEEVDAYAEERRTTGRDFTIPILLIVVGVISLAAGVWPERSQRQVNPG